MDEGLFAKHLKNLTLRTNIKNDIMEAIHTGCGIDINEEEFILQGKKIRIITTSVKRAALIRSHIEEELSKLGYTVEF
jgi:hypothetical protein